MGVLGKMEVELDIKSSGDVFHELFGNKPHHISNITPHKIHSCDVHEGEFGKPNSVIFWNYSVDGEKCEAKVVVEAIDEKSKLVRFKVIEGSILKEYKSFVVTLEVVDRGAITAVKWAVEFEKFEDFGPYPVKLMDFIIGMTRDIEAHHLNE
ncbi:MLP-like protein 31 [Chenopodium quinoa]|uniref:Bet v I/Major latex protein domain-containing protein n=1 Tax=Chenopodium quinoa TaxID=63459 RepID=A0A803N3Q8_CHEQI|nr:MLP-like protein 31 [Chenopodium quinoa]